jgi:hypothetical protein
MQTDMQSSTMNSTPEGQDLESSNFEEKHGSQITQHHESLSAHDHEHVSHVAKGDDSDGQVNWTWKQILATISLCGVYVG